jgi:hypothetical protein
MFMEQELSKEMKWVDAAEDKPHPPPVLSCFSKLRKSLWAMHDNATIQNYVRTNWPIVMRFY